MPKYEAPYGATGTAARIKELEAEIERLKVKNRRLNDECNSLDEECNRLSNLLRHARDDDEHKHVAKQARELEAA